MFRRYGVEEDVRREIESHIALRTEELVSEGWEPAAAREEAIRLFGDRVAVSSHCERITKSHHRVEGRMRMLGAMWQDVRYGVRALMRSPSFAFVAVVTLALGIGANTAIFSVVNGVLLRPLPYDDPHEIVWVREINTRGGTMSVAWANFVDWHRDVRSVEHIAAYRGGSTTVLGGAEPVQARVGRVSRDFWALFDVRPHLGRLTVEEEHDPAGSPGLVVSRTFWENQLNAQDLEGLTLEVYGVRAPVVGVVDGFDFPGGIDVWAPAEPTATSTSRTAHNWSVVARLGDGVAIEQAREEIDVMTRALVATEVDGEPDFLATGAFVVPLHEQVAGSARTPLLLLLGAAGLVLLVACTNLASTLLARGTARAREFSVRMSLGAPKGRVARQLLTESLVIAVLGGVAGVLVASGVMRVLLDVGGGSVPRLQDVTMDGWVLGYTGGVAVLTAFLFGLVPALRLTRGGPGGALRSGGRGNSVEGRSAIWRLLVGTEVGLALVVLLGAGLLVRSSQQLLAEDPGVDVTDVATAGITLSTLKYETPHHQVLWYDELLRELEAGPAVASAGIISSLPVGGFISNGRLDLDGDLESGTTAGYVVASTGAFEALDIPLLQGRLFDPQDGPDAEHVAVVSRSFAESVWPGLDPIGRSVSGGGMDNFWEDRRFARVVGVVGDVRFRGLGTEAYPTVYFPHTQRPFRIQFGASVVVEAAQGDPSAVAGELRSTIRTLDSDVPVRIVTQEEIVSGSMAERRFTMLLFGAFALIALVLAAVGIYGVVSYSVARRTREMGIRIALGADRGSVQRMVVKASMQMVLGGLVLGLLVATGLTGLMEGLLYGVTPTDPVTIAGVVLVLAATGFLSSWLPARAGTRVDPMVTMRAE